MLTYTKLWILLEKRGMKRTDLKQVISSATLAKLGKNEVVSSAVIEKVCAFLKCQPGEIMEYIDEESMRDAVQQIDIANRALMETLKAKGISEEQFATMMSQAMPELIKSMFNGNNTMNNIYDKVIENNLGKTENE